MSEPLGPRLPRPRIGLGSRVSIAGRPGTVVTYRSTSDRGIRYGVALDNDVQLPDVGEDVFDTLST